MSLIRDNRVLLASFVLILAVIATGCTVENNYLDYFYDLRVYGLDNFTTDNSSFLIFAPIPAYNGMILIEPYMLPEKIQKGPNSTKIYAPGFDLNITDSPYGKMFQGHGMLIDPRVTKMYRICDLRDIKKNRVEALKTVNMTPEEFIQAPITPLLPNDIETKYTKWVNGSNVKNFTTYIYIDENLKPVRDNASIEIVLLYEIFPKNSTRNGFYLSKTQRRVSMWSNDASGNDSYYICIHEIIPGNVTGFIPIKLQYVDNDAYHRFSSNYYPVSIV